MEASKRSLGIEPLESEPVFDNKIVIGDRTIHIPYIRNRVHKVLGEPKTGVSRSVKTQRVFLYSSPWAAINMFDPSKELSDGHVVVGKYQQKKPGNNSSIIF